MSSYSHPEGTLKLTGHDWMRWPLERYAECLGDYPSNEKNLNACVAEAFRDLRAKYGPDLDMGIPTDDAGEKYALRWHGLKLLSEVWDDEHEQE